MKPLIHFPRFPTAGWAWSLLVAIVFLAGCETVAPPEARRPANDSQVDDRVDSTLRAGDKLMITFADNSGIPPQWLQTVREDGTITLPLNQSIRAADKRIGALETEIRSLYVPNILRRLTVTVRNESRTYFVRGEVKAPGQREHTGSITAMQAISAAGDFTDFADKSDIEIIRSNGEKVKMNGRRVQRDPSLDVPVYPGDTVLVGRRYF